MYRMFRHFYQTFATFIPKLETKPFRPGLTSLAGVWIYDIVVVLHRPSKSIDREQSSLYGMVITYSKGKDQPGKAANNPARGQLNRECPSKYVGYGDLPAVTVQRFWTNHVETCVGVITPNSRGADALRQTLRGRCSLSHFFFSFLSLLFSLCGIL